MVQENAEQAVRQMLTKFSEEQKLAEVGTVTAEDQMDDGTPIRVHPSTYLHIGYISSSFLQHIWCQQIWVSASKSV